MWSLAMPIVLALLPLPLVLSRLLPPAQHENHALRLPPSIAEKLKAQPRSPAAGIGRTVLSWLGWIGLVCALADPRTTLTAGALRASGRDVILVLDFSSSMEQHDFTLDGKAARRVDALKYFAREFILHRSGDRVGLVVFASEAYVAAPLSFDLAESAMRSMTSVSNSWADRKQRSAMVSALLSSECKCLMHRRD